MVKRRPIRVLVVDDSALMRQVLVHILGSDPRLEVCGQAADPYEAWRVIQTESPDVITLDVEMPRMDGVTFLEKLMRRRPLPVVMISTLTQHGAEVTLRALDAGAIDFVPKPTANLAQGTMSQATEIVEKVVAAAAARVGPIEQERVTSPPPRVPESRDEGGARTVRLIAIGASTGGTDALARVLRSVRLPLPPVLIVQHMPSPFTTTFAQRLDTLGPLRVQEAVDGIPLEPGMAVLANGSQHLEVATKSGGRLVTHVHDAAPVSRHRPSVDVLFRSVATQLGRDAVGVILTGMGRDGASGLLEMRRAGALTIGQDADSCVVYGMPKAAFDDGAVMRQLHVDRVGPALTALFARRGRPTGASRV